MFCILIAFASFVGGLAIDEREIRSLPDIKLVVILFVVGLLLYPMWYLLGFFLDLIKRTAWTPSSRARPYGFEGIYNELFWWTVAAFFTFGMGAFISSIWKGIELVWVGVSAMTLGLGLGLGALPIFLRNRKRRAVSPHY